MTYIDYLNDFNRWLESNRLPASSQLLYFKILDVFNRTGWQTLVQVDNRRIMIMAEVSTEKTAIRARDALIAAGFITYQKGKKGAPGRYSLCQIHCNHYSKCDSINDSKNDSVYDSINDSKNDSHIKTKTKNKTKTLSPPLPPSRGETGCEREIDTDLFAQFWQAYPKKVDCIAAQKAFAKIQPSVELVETMLSAIERQRNSDQWRRDNGRYIPSPVKWLREQKWQDEVDVDVTGLKSSFDVDEFFALAVENWRKGEET